MNGDPWGRQPPLHVLRFISINVGREGTAHEIALLRDCGHHFDVLLDQNLRWSGHKKSHPFFDYYVPSVIKSSRPWAVTNTRKDNSQKNTKQNILSLSTVD